MDHHICIYNDHVVVSLLNTSRPVKDTNQVTLNDFVARNRDQTFRCSTKMTLEDIETKTLQTLFDANIVFNDVSHLIYNCRSINTFENLARLVPNVRDLEFIWLAEGDDTNIITELKYFSKLISVRFPSNRFVALDSIAKTNTQIKILKLISCTDNQEDRLQLRSIIEKMTSIQALELAGASVDTAHIFNGPPNHSIPFFSLIVDDHRYRYRNPHRLLFGDFPENTGARKIEMLKCKYLWQQTSLIIAFSRANKSHPLKDLIFIPEMRREIFEFCAMMSSDVLECISDTVKFEDYPYEQTTKKLIENLKTTNRDILIRTERLHTARFFKSETK